MPLWASKHSKCEAVYVLLPVRTYVWLITLALFAKGPVAARRLDLANGPGYRSSSWQRHNQLGWGGWREEEEERDDANVEKSR